jgi:hypothetical protein
VADLYQLLLTRLQQQGIEPNDLPLFLRDLTELLKSKSGSDVAALNERLNILGWHQAQLDYQSLQLALAWMEAEAQASSSSKHL